MNTLSLNQRSNLGDVIHKALPELDTEDIWRLTGEITDKQYSFLWALKLKGDLEELRKVIPEMMKFYQLTKQP